MRNCDFWSVRETDAMYKKYVSLLDILCKGRPYNTPTRTQWLYKDADTALQVEPGQLLQMSKTRKGEDGRDVRYFTFVRIEDYRRDSTDDYVESSGPDVEGARFMTIKDVDVYEVDNGKIHIGVGRRILDATTPPEKVKDSYVLKRPEIPPELLKLLVADLKPKADANLKAACPFRDEWKDPVPPCMKEAAHE